MVIFYGTHKVLRRLPTPHISTEKEQKVSIVSVDCRGNGDDGVVMEVYVVTGGDKES